MSWLENYIHNVYLRGAIVLFFWFFVFRVGLFVLTRIFLRIASKTKTDLDDEIIKRSSKPLTFLSFFIALNFALKEIVLEEKVGILSWRIVASLIALSIGWLVFVVVDSSILRLWKKLAKKTQSDIDDTLGNLIHEVLRVVIVVILVLYILDLWGIEIGPLLATLGIAGLAIALALQQTLSNVFAGISLILDKTFKVGEIIKLDTGEMGMVHKIGLRSTRIKTFDNELIIVPNSKLADSKIQNFFQPDPSIRVNVDFGVEYGNDPEYIKKLVIEEIEKIEIRDKSQEIRVLFLSMGESSLNFKVMFWVDDISKKWPAHQEAISRIYRRLYKEGIGIPFPQHTVWLREEGKVKPPSPFDKKFAKTREKYFPNFGYEYKEEEKTKKENEKKKENLKSKLKKLSLSKILKFKNKEK